MGRLVLAFMEAKKGAIAVLAQAGPDSSNLAGMKLRYGYPPPTLTMGSECVTESVVSALIDLQCCPRAAACTDARRGQECGRDCVFLPAHGANDVDTRERGPSRPEIAPRYALTRSVAYGVR